MKKTKQKEEERDSKGSASAAAAAAAAAVAVAAGLEPHNTAQHSITRYVASAHTSSLSLNKHAHTHARTVSMRRHKHAPLAKQAAENRDPPADPNRLMPILHMAQQRFCLGRFVLCCARRRRTDWIRTYSRGAVVRT